MNSKSINPLYWTVRQLMALVLSLLMIPVTQLDLYAQASGPDSYVELNAEQLDQLVAPIALYPDSLVAQILTASTYPDQVSAADNWLSQDMGLPPDQRAAGANAMDWDPSVKALIEFPSVLDNLAKNSAWASQLGNAYYNQPGDVMNAVQAMRLQAQQSNRLVSTPQQRVVQDNGVIEIVPVNPGMVYVPYYNPWAVWGGLFAPYPGFVVMAPPPGIMLGVGLAFAAGISIGVFGRFGWGFHAWSPGWRGGTVIYNHNTYISRSVRVYNHGNFGGHDRGVFEHGGRGVPGGYHPVAHAGVARAGASRGGAFAGHGGAYANRGGPATAGRGGAYANRGGPAAAGREGTYANRGGPAAAARGGASANRGGPANAGRGGVAAANRGGTAAARGGTPAARGGTPAAHGGTPAARGGTPAARGGAAAGHAAGGHASGGHPGGGHAAEPAHKK